MTRSGVWYGVAFGLMLVSLLGGGAAVLGVAPNWWALLSLFLFCVGAGGFAEGFIDGVRLWNSDRLNERDRALKLKEREQALARTAALTPARLTRLVPVNGGQRYLEMETERPARWLAWQRASEELLLWYLELGALTIGALVGRGTRHPFSDRTAWGNMLAEWDRVGLARKENGVATVALKTPEEIRALLTRGDIDWSLESDPPAIRPAPPEQVLTHAPVERKLA